MDTIEIPKSEYERLTRNTLREHLPEMAEMRRAGATYQQIADKFGCTRQRVYQLLKEATK